MRLLLLASLLVLLANPLAAESKKGSTDGADRHWSLRPRSQPAIPQFADPALRTWVRNPIDAFLLERLQQAGLHPASEADRRVLIRRLTFDLTGLPPTPEEVAAFVSDRRVDGYERLVDRLLASPAYGERWGRHWLDVVRFAESEGFEYDRPHAGAWRFRDYVIDSFNKDKPYDQFVREQLAGDEIDPDNPELQVAVGFNRLGAVRRNAGNQDLAFSRDEVLIEMTDILGTAFLGLTFGCARCHDHMFDEIPQADYYSLQAFFAATQERDVTLSSPREQAAWKTQTEQIEKEIKKLKESLTALKGEARQQAEQKLNECQRKLPAPLPVINSVLNVTSQRTPIHILNRGNPDKKERRVGPRFPGLLLASATKEFPADMPKPRTTLAQWITASDNPVTARVMVNRIWQRHFGRGIVATANDFGVNGRDPSHPELLDWLANTFVSGGWKIKPLHRLIVLSSAYRQSSQIPASVPATQSGTAKDSENQLWGRFPRRRLSAEEIRDAMLFVSGRLNAKPGGPSVVVPVDSDLVNLLYQPSQWRVTTNLAEHDRRSIYLITKRNLRLPFMEAFDQPDAQTSCANRESSTHALQALELLNGQLSNRLATAFAERLQREAGSDPGQQIERAWELAVGRAPNARERKLSCQFLERQPLPELTLAIFNWNAFLYVD